MPLPLPTTVNAAPNGHFALHQDVNLEVNRLAIGTGWRVLTAELQNGWTATSVRMRRRGDTVELKVAGLDGTASTASTFLSTAATPDLLPFLPGSGSPVEFHLWRSAGSDTTVGCTATNTSITGQNLKATASYQTVRWDVGTRDWPTTLPGTAL